LQSTPKTTAPSPGTSAKRSNSTDRKCSSASGSRTYASSSPRLHRFSSAPPL
jgi:hypothetical protein